MFGLYDGIGIDLAVLGMGEADANGNVNVTKFGVRVPGPGGFINISGGAKKVVFLGTFTTKGLVVAAENGKLCIKQEGSIKKLVAKVQQVSFSGGQASLKGKEVLYITERAVFVLRDDKLVLSEIAPGVDVQRDIIGQMDFIPEIDPCLKQMDARIFSFQRRQ
jgi:propionate CoA-transferase